MSNKEVITQIDSYFEELPKSYFMFGINKLEEEDKKGIELKGDYVEQKLYKIIFSKDLLNNPLI